jgi:RND family efflux transporter MFP subunit
MSHYDPAHMPPPDPEAQAALARKARRWLIGLAVAALALAIWGVVSRRLREADLAKLTLEAATPTVELVTPQVSTAVQELILPANVEAFYDAPIYARVNGYLKSWAHDIGDRVKAGEVLAVIDAPDLEQQVEQAKGDLGLSVAQAGLAGITAKRWTALRDQNAVSLQSTDEKTHDLTAKASAAAAAKANLEHLNALKSFLTLVAPFDGVVTARNTDIGALIDAGVGKRDLFRVADIHAMRIYTSVPQAYAAKMKTGLSARLLLPQYPGREFEAKVIANANAITLNSRTLLVQLLADNRDGALWPGAFGQIRFQLPPDGAPLSVPAGALVFLNGKPQVATLDDKNRVRLKTITIARDLGMTLEISTGLTPQDRVIKSPWQSIRDGELVRVMDEKDENGARGAAK